jgi:hypothetical protein
MGVLCASDLRPLHGGGIDPLVRAAGDAGATGIHLGGGLVLGDLEGVIPAIIRAGLAVPSMTLPLAPRALAPRKRLPSLAASDPEERNAAIALALEGLDAGVAAGVRWALLAFGPVTLPISRAELGASFARRELDPGEAGVSDLLLARDVRKAIGERLADACRWSLERLARPAESRAVTLVLPAGGTVWEAPSAREALALLDAFRGAPLGLLWAPGRLSAARALGLQLPDERVAAVAAASFAALETDAVGLDAGYLPGLGERDERLPARPELPRDAPIIVNGYPDSTDAEIARAVAAVTARYEAPPAPPR